MTKWCLESEDKRAAISWASGLYHCFDVVLHTIFLFILLQQTVADAKPQLYFPIMWAGSLDCISE